MLKKLSSLIILGSLSLNVLFAEDTLKVVWKGEPGNIESKLKLIRHQMVSRHMMYIY